MVELYLNMDYLHRRNMPCCHPFLEIFPGVAKIVPYPREDLIQLLEHLD